MTQLSRTGLIALRSDIVDHARADSFEQQGILLRQEALERGAASAEDVVSQWLAIECDVGPDFESQPDELVNACREWTTDASLYVPTQTAVRQALERTAGARWRVDKTRGRIVVGVALRAAQETASVAA